MANITTQICKDAIVAEVCKNPSAVLNAFGVTDFEFAEPAKLTKNWKRIEKHREGELTYRCFDCTPYDDQLRAYVYDDGVRVLRVEIVGE